MFKKFATGVLAIAQVAHAAIPADGSLEACNEVAAHFENTCPSTGDDPGATVETYAWSDTEYVYCPGASIPLSYNWQNPCTYTRKLCVRCAETNGEVRITVSGNGLPSHGYDSTGNYPVAKDFEWSAVFNPQVSSSTPHYSAADFDSPAKTDEKLCDAPSAPSKMSSASNFSTSTSPDHLSGAVGIALTGVHIYNSISSAGKDVV